MFERDKGELRQFGFDVETVHGQGLGFGRSGHHAVPDRQGIQPAAGRQPDPRGMHRADPGGPALGAGRPRLRRRERRAQAAGRRRPAPTPNCRPASSRASGPPARPSRTWSPPSTPSTRSASATSPAAPARRRNALVEPWGLGSRFGQWYLVGHDRARGAKRFFRLSRLTSAVTVLDKETFTPPPDFNVRAELASLPGAAGAGPPSSTSGRHAAGAAQAGHRRRPLHAALNAPGTARRGTPAAGWDRLSVPFRDAETLGEELASYGPRVLVVVAARARRRRAAPPGRRRRASPPPRSRPSPSRMPAPAKRDPQAHLRGPAQADAPAGPVPGPQPGPAHQRGRRNVRHHPQGARGRPADPDLLRPARGLPGRAAGHPVGRRPRLHQPGPRPEPARPLHRGRGLRPADRAGNPQRPARNSPRAAPWSP